MRGTTVGDLPLVGLAAKLKACFVQVPGALCPAFGEAAAVRVHRDASIDEDALLDVIPLIHDEGASFAAAAVPDVLEPGKGDVREALVWEVHVDIGQLELRFCPEPIADHLLAAVVEVIDYGDGNHIAGLVCYRLDPGLRLLQRAVVLDPGEAESAISELDRMNRELDDSPAA